MGRCRYDSCKQPAKSLSSYCEQHGLEGPIGPRFVPPLAAVAVHSSLLLQRFAPSYDILTKLVNSDLAIAAYTDVMVASGIVPAARQKAHLSDLVAFAYEPPKRLATYTVTLIGVPSKEAMDEEEGMTSENFLTLNSPGSTAHRLVHDAIMTVAAAPPYGLGIDRTLQLILGAPRLKGFHSWNAEEEFLLKLASASRNEGLFRAPAIHEAALAEAVGRLVLERSRYKK